MAVDVEDLAMGRERKRGGWITLPFIFGAKLAVGVAATGLSSNLTVFLIQQFNIPSIYATQIGNIATGTSQFAPVVGSIVSNALGCFNVICGASLASFLGSLLFLLISLSPSLRPPACLSETCQPPTAAQLALLCSALALILAGSGSTRFVTGTFGAEQSDGVDQRASFFNWFVMCEYASSLLGLTVVIYVQDSLGWTWGFGLSSVLSAVGIIVLLLGIPHYRHPMSRRNSAKALAIEQQAPFLHPSSNEVILGCSKEEEEVGKKNVSSVIRLMPLFLAGVNITISICIVSSLTILQALVMDRELGLHFVIPASTMTVFISIATILSIPILERVIFPLSVRMFRHRPTPLQRIGAGYFVNTLSTAAAAVIEARRLRALEGSAEPMSVLWLIPALVLVGLGEALQFSAGLAFFHQELPDSSSNWVMGTISLMAAIGFYASTGIVALVQKITPWLQDDTNSSRLDNVYWMLTVMGALNLGYFCICKKLYKM